MFRTDLEPPKNGWYEPLVRTATGDVLVGRITGWSARTELADQIRASGLSSPIQGLVWQVVQRTRLSRSEKLDVAAELIAHFADGIAAGVVDEELIASFGDPAKTAKWIRKAKLRNRSMPRRVVRFVRQSLLVLFGILIGTWAILWVRYQVARPNIAVDYVALLDAQVDRSPPDERGWPIYREAFLGLQEEEWNAFDRFYAAEFPKNRASGRSESIPLEQSEAARWVQSHESLMKQLHDAARQPYLGFLHTDPENAAYAERVGIVPEELAEPNGGLMGVLLPYCNELRSFARMLFVESELALHDGRGADFQASILAQVGIADQVWSERRVLIGQLVSYVVLRDALTLVRQSLTEQPDLLSQEQLVEIAHRISSFADGGPVRIDFQTESAMFDDVLQRIYTDDGEGDGYLVGSSSIESLLGERYRHEDLGELAARQVIGPIVPVVVASRRAMTEQVHHYFDLMQLEAAKPAWQRKAGFLDRELKELAKSPIARMRYGLLLVLLPAMDRAAEAADRITTERDATQVAIALVLYRRANGRWPESLDKLVPQYLPAAPLDPADGQPLRYRIENETPILYSIGSDRVDDSGTPASSGKNDFSEKDGDWILWPLPKNP